MNRLTPILLLILCAVLITGTTAEAKGPPPEGRTYFVYVTGLDEDPYAAQADCLTFDATEACTPDGQTCLTWERTTGGLQTNKESGISLTAQIDEDGLIITLESQGRVDSRGSKSSIAVVGHATALDGQLNFTFSGRQVSRGRCLRMVEAFTAQASSR